MKKIVIIGCGFGGLAAAGVFARAHLKAEIYIIDKKRSADFLPLLPDAIGRGIKLNFLSFNIAEFAKRFCFFFMQEEVVSLNLEKKEVITANSKLNYDYLIISSGSETNFYGNENIKKYGLKVDSASDVQKILEILNSGNFDNFIIGGGGYTGIEIATNLRLFLKKNKRRSRIVVVERARSILGPLPEWMKEYVLNNLKEEDIEVVVNNSIEKVDAQSVHLSDGTILNNALLIWAAGVKTPGFIQNLLVQKNPQGRINVDEFLRLNENCFVIGDASSFSWRGNYLRMAVQFTLMQGNIAAKNIISCITKKRMRIYKPLDLGYIIPMANNRSCGKLFGINLKGILPTMLHFLMCIFRSYGLKNKIGLIKDLIKGG